MATLNEVCTIIMGQSPSSSTYNAEGIGLPFFQGNADFGDEYPTIRLFCSSPIKIAEKGDVLVSVRAPIGAVNKSNQRCCIGRGLSAIRPIKDKSDDRYLYHLLISNRNYLESRGTGSTFKAITGKVLSSVIVPVHNLSEQKVIASILDKIVVTIQKRKKQIKLYDDLVKSQFIEMFGDPASNPYGWDVVAIGDVVTEVRYGTSNPAVEGGQYPYLRMNNITYDGHLDLSDMKYIDISDDEIEKYIVRKGDVLFNRTNSVELVGKTCLFELDDPMVIAGYIIRIRLNNRLLPVVLSNYLNSNRIKDRLRSMAKGAVNQANINAKELQSIKVYLPPIDRQNKFSHFVEQTDKSKFRIKQSLEKLEILYKALLQKYFG